MRVALWLMALFAVAAASALFAGSNPGSVTLFWAPYRVDLSLNLALLLLCAGFLLLHIALRALTAMLNIPAQARRWRLQQRERAIQAGLLDALAHLVGGRFIRSRKAAEHVLSLEESVAQGGEQLGYGARLRALAHLLAAESAHALQDRSLRDAHFDLALRNSSSRDAQDMRDGVHMRAARWAFDDRDAARSMQWLDRLPQGAARRTVALRLRFKAARLAGQPLRALETARLLTKHRAFSEVAGVSIARGLAMEHLRSAHDPAQLVRAWTELEPAERAMPDVALQGAERLLALGGEATLARQWLLPVWDAMVRVPSALNTVQALHLIRVLEQGFGSKTSLPDAHWLARIESAQLANPRDAGLQYLAGIVCMRLALWGKAQQLLKQALATLQDSGLRRDAWRALAELAEQRNDPVGATDALRSALREALRT